MEPPIVGRFVVLLVSGGSGTVERLSFRCRQLPSSGGIYI